MRRRGFLNERPHSGSGPSGSKDGDGRKADSWLDVPKAMPVVLQQEDWLRWLDGPAEDAPCLAAPFTSQLGVRA